jgi:hypothetical protein
MHNYNLRKHLCFLFVWILLAGGTQAQQTYTVTDKSPVVVDGLEMGFTIKSTEEKTVGDKGEFSRYAIRFYIKNTTAQEKIILYKQGLNLMNNVSDQLVQFNCLNATGARLTTKSAILSAAPCNVLAQFEETDCNTKKTIKSKRFVQIGYSIKGGQTFTTDGIVIVPLNQQPNMQAVYLANQLQPIASAGAGSPQDNNNNLNNNSNLNAPQQIFTAPGFKRIRNFSNGSYLNLETGNLGSSAIRSDWPSAQWKITQVQGSGYYSLTNRLKANLIAIERINLIMSRSLNTGSSWTLEPTQDANAFKIKNAGTGEYLCIIANQLTISSIMGNDKSSIWIFE